MPQDCSEGRGAATHPLDHVEDPVDGPVDADLSVVDDYLRQVAARPDVEVFDSVSTFDDPQEFEATWERAAHLRGSVVVVVVNGAGDLLLVENAWMDGYGIPGGGVEPGEDWETAAVREVREETGVEVELERPLAVYGGVDEHGEDRFRGPYTLKYLAHPIDEGELADNPGEPDEEIMAVDWFSSVPDDANDPPALERTFRRFARNS